MKSEGTQSISRAVALMRLISSYSVRGARLTDLANDARLTMPTARRMLKCLADEGLIEQDAQTRRYRIGALTFELGLASYHHSKLIGTWRPLMERLAVETGDAIYLVIRNGLDSVCLDRVVGDYPIKAMVLDVGGRLPLGIGSGSIALLASLADDEVNEIIAKNSTRLPRFVGYVQNELKKAVARTRKEGYGLTTELITPGVSAIGLAIPEKKVVPFAALSISAVSSRFNGDRQATLVAALSKAIADGLPAHHKLG